MAGEGALAGGLLDDQEGAQGSHPDGRGVRDRDGIIQGQVLHRPEVAADGSEAKQAPHHQQPPPVSRKHRPSGSC